MTKETMTIHKALSELKTLDKRICEAIEGASFVLANKHSNEKIKGASIPKTISGMKSDYSKVTDLIRRRNAIKQAVVASNAVTKVVVDGVEYTVATAIDAKNYGMYYNEMLLECMRRQLANAQSEMDKNTGDALEKKAEQYILAMIQAQPKESKLTAGSDVIQKLRGDYIKNNSYDLIDPLDIKEVISKLNDQILTFRSEIDAALSCSNALTVIEIEY